MYKTVIFTFLYISINSVYCQLKTDEANGIYIGKLVYVQKGNIAKYRLQFPIDFSVDYGIAPSDDQIFFYFLQNRNFHYSELADTSLHYYNAMYLFRNDTFYSASNLTPKVDLDIFNCGNGSHLYFNDVTGYDKNKWYDFTMECNQNVWTRFKGYQIALIYDGYTFHGRRNKIVFLSKPIK